MTFRLGIALALIAGIAAFIILQAPDEQNVPLQSRLASIDVASPVETKLISSPALAATRANISGKQLYTRRCGACHSVDQNRVGPRHRGVYGRKAGAVSDYKYSKALKTLGVRWNEKNLDRWLANPTAVAPGTSMGFRLTKPTERKAIIEYLKSIS